MDIIKSVCRGRAVRDRGVFEYAIADQPTHLIALDGFGSSFEDSSDSYSGGNGSASNILIPCLISFAAGAATVSLAWFGAQLQRKVRQGIEEQLSHGQTEEDEVTAEVLSDGDNTTWWMKSVDDIKSRIGELPRRSHWPWETIRKKVNSVFQGVNGDGDAMHGSQSTASLSSLSSTQERDDAAQPQRDDVHAKDKSNFCIGSIFGMDVGGTLAKLVYFEQQRGPTDYKSMVLSDRTHLSTRERSYHQAASAQAVLRARRGSADIVPDEEATDHIKPTLQRRRTVSLGVMGRVKAAMYDQLDDPHVSHQPSSSSSTSPSKSMSSSPQAQQQVQQQQQHKERRRSSVITNSSAAPAAGGGHAHMAGNEPRVPLHSQASDDDLRPLYQLRQESVPDDLNHFADSINDPSWDIDNDNDDDGNDRDNDIKGIQNHHNIAEPRRGTPTKPTENETGSGLKKSRSMVDLSLHSNQLRNREEALDRFYHFARRLDSYREGVKDHQLSFYSRQLGGEFHFIRFETRRMSNAIDLIRANNLHLNIKTMGATGGGAHKFANEWDEFLGIEMDKQEELDCLVAGMQFVLSTVVGECYTFRPDKSKKRQRRQQQQQQQQQCEIKSPSSSPKNGNELQEETDLPTTVESADLRTSVSRMTFQESDAGLSASHSQQSERHQQQQQQQHHSSEATNDTMTDPLNNTANQNENDLSDDDDDDDDINDDSSADETPIMQNKADGGDDWWWSRKVQRDAISYSSTYPYLIVTIGTGVSILRVDGPRKHERISGSTIGGGTYWGLIRLLTDVEDFEDVLKLAYRGDPTKVDMMVGDIYGNNSDALEKLGLPSHVVASSFGKLVAKEDPAEGLTQEDLARALLLMVTNNIGQVAYLNAKLHKTPRIYFVGNFLRRNKLSQKRLSYAISYWSKGEMEALFLEHEGYFGALGAFLLSQNISDDTQGFTNWNERQGSSGSSSDSGKSNAASCTAKDDGTASVSGDGTEAEAIPPPTSQKRSVSSSFFQKRSKTFAT